MSSLTINGVKIFSAVDQAANSQPAAVTPSFATHRLVDGQWVLKGATTVSTQKATLIKADQVQPRPIGFTVETAMENAGKVPLRCLPNRAAYLAAIRQAAGKVLASGKDTEAVAMISRGRFGGRKDNISGLQWLLWRYERAAA